MSDNENDVAARLERHARADSPEEAATVGEIAVTRDGANVEFSLGTFKFSAPAPSPPIVDRWWEKYGGFVLGALVGAGSMAAGVVLTRLADKE